MDLYTTSFSFPPPVTNSIRSSASPLPAASTLPGSDGLPTVPLPNVTSATEPHRQSSSATSLTTVADSERDWQAVQKTALDITSREGCLVTVTKEQLNAEIGSAGPSASRNGENENEAIPQSTTYNYHLSGSYQAVMAARGAILREAPRDNRTIIKVARTEILENPTSKVSPLKPDVARRINDIAVDSRGHIFVLNMDYPGGGGVGGTVLASVDGQGVSNLATGHGAEISTKPPSESGEAADRDVKVEDVTDADTSGQSSTILPGSDSQTSTGSTGATSTNQTTGTNVTSYGLETERLCELVISGSMESVEIAKMRMLVLLDELSGLHAECCDIDYKLHAIIAARKRSVLQNIQEETATNIYFSTPLVGVLHPPQPGTQLPSGYRSLVDGNISMQPTGNLGLQTTGYMQGMGGMAHNHNAGMDMAMGMSNGYAPSHSHQHQLQLQQQHHQAQHFHQHQHQHHHHQPHHGHHNHHQYHNHQMQQHQGLHDPQNQGPVYNPHQHVQFPYQPQPMNINTQGGRGMPYAGPGVGHFGPGPSPMNHNMGQLGGMSVNHTGMSHMSQAMTVYQGNRLTSPMPMSPGPSMHHNHRQGPIGPGNHMMQHGAHGPGAMGGPYSQHGHNPMAMIGPMGANHGGHGGHMTGMEMTLHGHNHAHGFNQAIQPFDSSPHPGLSSHGGEQGILGKANQIWITGEFFNVQRARDMLLNIAMQKSKLVISRDTAILPRKLDWLLTERLEEFRSIMSDNGTYVQVPPVGSQASLISVFGDHRANIERTIRSLMGLACQFYVASIWLLPISFDVLMPQASLNPAQMQPILKRIAHATGAEVVFKSNCFEIHGLEQEVRAAVMMVLELDDIQSFHHEIRFQIELSNEHREFISGKKNGKINKIMKLAGVKIKFETFNDYNFLIDISGSNIGALHGLSLLQEELPAEVSFHVPETYHKRIIGVGGKNIQRIMKLFGVYVKFSNAEEFAALGGYADNEDNVIARTPAKNAINLENLKQAVMEMVSPKDKDYTIESVSIPRRYHRTLLGEKSIFIHDIEQKTNSLFRFPYKESASDIVTIFGPESQVHIAAAMLLDHVPFEADLHVPPNPELTRLVTSPEFIVFTETIKRDHQIAIVPSAKFGQGDEAILKFRCQRSNIDFLGTARDTLEEYLGQHGIQVYPSAAHKRVDSFTDAFSHFNSKLLAHSANAAEGGEGESLVERRSRPATVATTVKALFEGQDAQSSTFRSNDDNGFAGPLSYHGRVQDYWQPPSTTNTHQRTESEITRREPELMVQDPRVRQASTGHPQSHAARSVSARTQSLDITSLNYSRALAGGSSAFAPMLPSPGADNASPNTATGSFFPGSSGHVRANLTGRPKSTYDSNLDTVTQGLSNVQVSHQ